VIPPHHLDIVNNDTKQDKIIFKKLEKRKIFLFQS